MVPNHVLAFFSTLLILIFAHDGAAHGHGHIHRRHGEGRSDLASRGEQSGQSSYGGSPGRPGGGADFPGGGGFPGQPGGGPPESPSGRPSSDHPNNPPWTASYPTSTRYTVKTTATTAHPTTLSYSRSRYSSSTATSLSTTSSTTTSTTESTTTTTSTTIATTTTTTTTTTSTTPTPCVPWATGQKFLLTADPSEAKSLPGGEWLTEIDGWWATKDPGGGFFGQYTPWEGARNSPWEILPSYNGSECVATMTSSRGEPLYMVGYPDIPGADPSPRRYEHWDWLNLLPQRILDEASTTDFPLEFFRCTIAPDTLELTYDLNGDNRWLECEEGASFHNTAIFYGDELAIPPDCYPIRLYAQLVD